MSKCIFCQIVKKEVPAEIIADDDKIIVFKDIRPKAPIHFLIVPKEHINSVNHLQVKDKELIANLILTAVKITKENKIKGYKLIFNVEKEGGQVIDHLHLHLLAGWLTPEQRDVPGMP